MTNRKHTPGPWYVGTEFNDQGRHIYAAQKVRHEDGDEWHPLIACTDDDERLVDWQANAVLIAAAPDLLEALKRVMDNDCPLTGSPSHAELVEHWEYEKSQGRGEADDQLFALAAIAKATSTF